MTLSTDGDKRQRNRYAHFLDKIRRQRPESLRWLLRSSAPTLWISQVLSTVFHQSSISGVLVAMTGFTMSRIPTPTTGLRKLNITEYTTNMVKETLKSAARPKTSLKDTQPTSKVVLKRRKEIYAPGYLTDNQVRFDIMYSLNPNLDRTEAVIGHPSDAKLTIVLYKPPFGASGDPLHLTYPNEVHWERESSIRSLNKWRAAVFHHYLGLGPQQTSDWHQMEKDFILEACAVREEQARSRPFKANKTADGHLRPYSWLAITNDFNCCFSGRKLPGYDEPRPARKRTDLVAQYCRMQEEAKPFIATAVDDGGLHQRRRASAGSLKASSIPKPKSNSLLRHQSLSGVPKPSRVPRPRSRTLFVESRGAHLPACGIPKPEQAHL